jgi:GDPmannose 4,6-dehydratase
MKTALVTGITGQDGSYLAEFLLYKGYEVHGIIRRSSTFNTSRLDHIYRDPHSVDQKRLILHYADLTDATSLIRVLEQIKPDEVFHLGAQSHVRVSFDVPDYTVEATGMGTLRLLDALHTMKMPCKFYQAGSSEMFGGLYDGNTCLDEKCRFHPRSPYGCAKVFAHNIVVNYRESYGMFAANGILFNHESPRRGETFVTRKITKYVADLYHNPLYNVPLYLGNLDAKRDWGYSPEYVVAMWKILQQEQPGDFVIATGETHSVAEFLDEAFRIIDVPWRDHVQFDDRYVRPAEVEVLLGNADKAAQVLKWKPQVTFKQIVKIMVTADITKQETGLEEIWKKA